jgi:hypothetical protein
VGAGHAEEVFTHPNMSFNASQEKKFKASHFFVDSPFELRKNSIQDSIVKELTPKLKQYSPRAYLEVQKKVEFYVLLKLILCLLIVRKGDEYDARETR